MKHLSGFFEHYKNAIRSLPAHQTLTKDDVLTEQFRIAKEGEIEVYYAPHNEYVNQKAKVMVVGLTPGWTQTRIAYETARDGLELGLDDTFIIQKCKEQARFAGTMREHLIEMLDRLELQTKLGISSCREGFEAEQTFFHTTSMLRFPVFINQKNYTGFNPHILSNPMLLEMARAFMEQELLASPTALIIPLGKAVELVLHQLCDEGGLASERFLWGFPHPSGANGHRHKQFEEHAARMKEAIEQHFSHPDQSR